MKTRTTSARALLFLTAVLAVVAAGTALAHHGDGFRHDDPAGTIASFDPDTNMLAIDLANGGNVSGKVTRLTWIDCDDDSHWDRSRHLFHGSDDDDGWDHRRHCSTDDLTAGATVDDAVLGLRDGGAFFWKVDLEDESDSDDS
jgi:hypothetical protein